jgi:hypothetical protein
MKSSKFNPIKPVQSAAAATSAAGLRLIVKRSDSEKLRGNT